MPPSASKVSVLYPRPGQAEDLPVPVDRLGAAVRELHNLGRCAERICCDSHGSATNWEVQLARLKLRLPEVRSSLAELAVIRAGHWPNTEWAVRFRGAHDEVERRLVDITASMSSLIHREPGGIDIVGLSFECTKLAEAADDLCRLIASQYPKAVADC